MGKDGERRTMVTMMDAKRAKRTQEKQEEKRKSNSSAFIGQEFPANFLSFFFPSQDEDGAIKKKKKN